ncbi:protein NRT1/ PTR FAMILY 2.13 [Andrographis paniculata]|uniref:protein NRT1/ PTR FAMILY 2.13 n=1 Tax=Andrographis paniculata TaxID=175694 RepID=UPI0021E8E1FC|nr:protein NRT1/ PTR FAMILY 2.13 [Andrographis paniculata]
MEALNDKRERVTKSSSSSYLAKLQCCFHPAKLSSSNPAMEDGCDEGKFAVSEKQKRKPGGWKSMPFILGNETCERLATVGMLANFSVFLMTQFHMDQVLSSNVMSVWNGFTSFSPLLGAFISDSYLGRFKTLAFATISAFMGMMMLTVIMWIPKLHPPPCSQISGHKCAGPTGAQFGLLAVALGFLTVGSAGIRPCSIPFGVDQFDAKTEEGRRGITSFFNWYYMTFTVVLIIALTLVVYIQSSVSWVLGFALPTGLMLFSIVLFFVGMRLYVYVQPEGSVFSGIVQVIVASYKKRKLKIPEGKNVDGVYYDPPLKGTVAVKLPLTDQLRFFNKAALIMDGEVLPDGSSANPWRLCSVQTVEETKCLFRIIPVWASGIIFCTAMAQQGTFMLSQALKMDRSLGPHFKVPAGSLAVISMITIGIWLPIYDRVLVPYLRKTTKLEGGITQLQRMGIGIVFSIMSMIVAGLVERMRRASAVLHAGPDGIAPISVFWLSPQLILMGFAEAFNIIGQIEFYNKEFPENLTSLANSLFSCTMAAGNYFSVVVVNVIHKTTGKNGHPDWLTADTNKGRIENLYFLIAGFGVLNLGYFLWVARMYRYKSKFRIEGDGDGDDVEKHEHCDIELNGIKK